MKLKKMLFLVNPYAGKKKGVRALADMISVFNRGDWDVSVYITAAPGDGAAIVQQRAAEFDCIVCCGGDGTYNETITGILRSGTDVPVGYIPTGSTNDFANSLHLPGECVKAALAITEGTPERFDAGRFNDRYFSYVASFGAFTKASYATPQSVKNALGHTAYILGGISELSQIHPEHVRLETADEVIEGDYIFGAVCNSTSVGGILTLDPGVVDLQDGKFEMLLVRAPQNLGELTECIEALQKHTYNCNMLTFRSASKVHITTANPMSWTLDGEQADAATEVTIENVPLAVALRH